MVDDYMLPVIIPSLQAECTFCASIVGKYTCMYGLLPCHYWTQKVIDLTLVTFNYLGNPIRPLRILSVSQSLPAPWKLTLSVSSSVSLILFSTFSWVSKFDTRSPTSVPDPAYSIFPRLSQSPHSDLIAALSSHICRSHGHIGFIITKSFASPL